MVNRSSDINDFVVQGKGIPLGFEVHAGPGLYILWAAFACLFASVVPYMIRWVGQSFCDWGRTNEADDPFRIAVARTEDEVKEPQSVDYDETRRDETRTPTNQQ
jgi:hypothetical protein